MNEKVFKEFPKISRLESKVTITLKLDGTNACVCISDDGEQVYAQSRNRLIAPGCDNMGFAYWVEQNAETLKKDLGPGHHYGEWWGCGIGRKYNLNERRFSLFNTRRFREANFLTPNMSVVPVIYQGPFSEEVLQKALEEIRSPTMDFGTPGWTKHEGVVVFWEHDNSMKKVILDK